MKFQSTIAFALVVMTLLSAAAALDDTNQYQPVIGILTQPTNDLDAERWPADSYQYIASSYVKFLMASGARVIPIRFDLPPLELDALFEKINGLVFPGGDASLWMDEDRWIGFSPMTQVGARLILKVIEAKKQGKHFPLWGTCMGYELIVLAITNDVNALSRLDSNNHVLNTKLENYKESAIYQSLSGTVLSALQFREALYYNHRYGLSLDRFANSHALTQFFKLTSSSVDNSGTPFVATLEGKEVPIYVSQFHPEKNQFEWLESVHANHSPDAMVVGQEFGNFFVNEARKNDNRMTEDEIKALNIEFDDFAVVYDSFISIYYYKNFNVTSAAY